MVNLENVTISLMRVQGKNTKLTVTMDKNKNITRSITSTDRPKAIPGKVFGLNKLVIKLYNLIVNKFISTISKF